MNSKVDLYLEEGCGRCAFYQTPQCKVHSWPEELKKLRSILLECGLTEELKWKQPCYTFQGKNILILSAFKEYVALNLFKGVLLADPDKILIQPGESSQSARQIRFTNINDIVKMEPTLKAYIFEAIEVERAGMKVKFKKNPEPIPEEFREELDKDPDLKKAFESLTPGRQRGYLLHFSSAKQSKTRKSRIEKCKEKIFNGEGLQDDYKRK